MSRVETDKQKNYGSIGRRSFKKRPSPQESISGGGRQRLSAQQPANGSRWWVQHDDSCRWQLAPDKVSTSRGKFVGLANASARRSGACGHSSAISDGSARTWAETWPIDRIARQATSRPAPLSADRARTSPSLAFINTMVQPPSCYHHPLPTIGAFFARTGLEKFSARRASNCAIPTYGKSRTSNRFTINELQVFEFVLRIFPATCWEDHIRPSVS